MNLSSHQLADHFFHPRNAGALEGADLHGYADLNGAAPRVNIYACVSSKRITATGFTAFGCGHVIACCSALTELMNGRSLVQCRGITSEQVSDEVGGLASNKRFCADLVVRAMMCGLDAIE